MVQKNGDFSPSQISQILSRPEAQALLERLKQMDQAALQQAVSLAFQGRTDQAKDVLTPLMQDEQVQSLAQKMRDDNGGI